MGPEYPKSKTIALTVLLGTFLSACGREILPESLLCSSTNREAVLTATPILDWDGGSDPTGFRVEGGDPDFQYVDHVQRVVGTDGICLVERAQSGVACFQSAERNAGRKLDELEVVEVISFEGSSGSVDLKGEIEKAVREGKIVGGDVVILGKEGIDPKHQIHRDNIWYDPFHAFYVVRTDPKIVIRQVAEDSRPELEGPLELVTDLYYIYGPDELFVVLREPKEP